MEKENFLGANYKVEAELTEPFTADTRIADLTGFVKEAIGSDNIRVVTAKSTNEAVATVEIEGLERGSELFKAETVVVFHDPADKSAKLFLRRGNETIQTILNNVKKIRAIEDDVEWLNNIYNF